MLPPERLSELCDCLCEIWDEPCGVVHLSGAGGVDQGLAAGGDPAELGVRTGVDHRRAAGEAPNVHTPLQCCRGAL